MKNTTMPEAFSKPYTDRREAGRKLAQSLLQYKGRADVLVLAASREGVFVGDGIADVLHVPLDVYLPDHKVLASAGISLAAFVEAAKPEQEALDRLEAFYIAITR